MTMSPVYVQLRARVFVTAGLLAIPIAGCDAESPRDAADLDDPADLDATGADTEFGDDEMLEELAGSSTGEALHPGSDALGLDPSDEAEPIIVGPNTTTDIDSNPAWPQVVHLQTATGGWCSGTLVSPTQVLTAGHCNIGTGGSVRLDTPATGTAPTGATYPIVQTQTRSSSALSGQDLSVVLLGRAVPSYGAAGSPLYSVSPASTLSSVSNAVSTWAAGYGPTRTGCTPPTSGFARVRRAIRYDGGFRTYASVPGVITRQNLPCGDTNAGPLPGDSGGPLLDTFGRVVGVFSGWGCRTSSGTTAGGSQCNQSLPNTLGTVEWTSVTGSNRTWIDSAMAQDFDGDGMSDGVDPLPAVDCRGSSPPSACTAIKPDFEIVSITSAGCTSSGGSPQIAVTVRNDGPQPQWTYVDVWDGLAYAPSVGDLSSNWKKSATLQHRQTQTLYFTVNPAQPQGYIDVIVDTTQTWAELDENDNVGFQWISFPDCSFG